MTLFVSYGHSLDGYQAGRLFAIKVDSEQLIVQCDEQGMSLDKDSLFQYKLGETEIKTFRKLWTDAEMDERDRGVVVGSKQVPFLVESGLIMTNSTSLDQRHVAVHQFIVMELLGKSVLSSAKCMCKGWQGHMCTSRSPSRFLAIARSCLRALESIHARGLIHRDVKSANFCYKDQSGQEEVCIIDFGFCRPIDQDLRNRNGREVEDFVGTPDYASHQALRGLPQRSFDDLESLAYTFLELYLGKLPWDLTYSYEPGADGWEGGSSHINPDDWTESRLCQMSNQRADTWDSLLENPRGSHVRIPCFIQEWMSYINGLEVNETIDYDLLDEILCRGVPLDQDEQRRVNPGLGQRILALRGEEGDEPGGDDDGQREYHGLRSCEGSVGDEVVMDSQGSWGEAGVSSQGLGSLHAEQGSQGSNGSIKSTPFPHDNDGNHVLDDMDINGNGSGAQRLAASGSSEINQERVKNKREKAHSGIIAIKRGRYI